MHRVRLFRHVRKVNVYLVSDDGEAGFHQAVLIFQSHGLRKLPLLPQAGCHPYAELVFSFCVITAGGLDLYAGEEGRLLCQGVSHVAYDDGVACGSQAVVQIIEAGGWPSGEGECEVGFAVEEAGFTIGVGHGGEELWGDGLGLST